MTRTKRKKTVRKNDLSFHSGNLKLDGTLFYPTHKKPKNPAILFVHGWTSERKRSFQYAKALSDLGYVCLLFDMRGHGTSEGDMNKYTTKEFLDDAIVAYDYLSRIEDVDTKNISAVGSSFGGYLVAILSSKRKIINIVLRVPADYPNELFDKPKRLTGHDNPKVTSWRNEPKKPTDSYALKALHKFIGNVLIIESEEDDIIPRQVILNYSNNINNRGKITHVIMKGTPHSIKKGKFRDEVERILIKQFRKWL